MAKTTPKTFSFGGVKIDVINQKDAQVPKQAHEVKLKSEDAKALALGLKHDLPCLLVGETGTGKTSAVRYLAYKRKQGYTRINMHGYNTPDELIGSKSVKDGSTYYENGILTNAMLKGHIVVLDEINATPPDCMFIIHGLLDDDKQISLPNGDVIRPHEDFRFFATMNPDYEGTRGLNRAFMDRFNVILSVDVLSPDKEETLLKKRISVSDEEAKNMVATAWMARKAYQDQKTLTFVSTRSLIQWGELAQNGLGMKAAYVKSIVNKARSEEQTAFKDFYNAVFKAVGESGNDDMVPVVKTRGEIRNYETRIEQLEKAIQTHDQKVRDYADTAEKLAEKLRLQEVDADRVKKADEVEAENKRLKVQIRNIAQAITP